MSIILHNLTDTAVLRQSVSTLSANHSSEEESAEELRDILLSLYFLTVDLPPSLSENPDTKAKLFENKKNF